MQESDYPSTEILYWKDVRQDLKDTELVRIIDELDPGIKFRFLRLRYSYGATIVHEGNIQIPLQQNKYIPLQDPNVPYHIKEMLGYSTIPLGLLMNKASEIFVSANQRIVPINMLSPGSFFGLFETLSALSKKSPAAAIWSVFAGARSTFMLPKITEAVAHRRLRVNFGLTNDAPKSLFEHCAIFSAINDCQFLEKRWYSDVLLFANDWFKHDIKDRAWLELQNYLFRLGWEHTKVKFDNIGRQMLWEVLAAALATRRLKPRCYLIDTVKHLISIGMGALPGFQISDDSELAIPSRCIEEAYVTIYNLDHLPILIYPHTLSYANGKIPVYYSMTLPTLIEGYPTQRGTPSIIMDLRDIKTIIETPHKLVNTKHLLPMIDVLNKIDYAYFHPELDPLAEITLTSAMVDSDLQLKNYLQKYKNKTFPANAPFLCGCIKTRRTNNNGKITTIT